MLAPTASPVHLLVSSWFKQQRPPAITTDLRVSLFIAATEEILLNKKEGRVYDPLSDNRFKWGAQWLDLGDRCIRAIDPAIQLAAEFTFNPPSLASRQFLPS